MNLLHLVFTFNLVTAFIILAGGYYLHLKYDENVDGVASVPPSGLSAAGLFGVALGVSLLSGVATMFA